MQGLLDTIDRILSIFMFNQDRIPQKRFAVLSRFDNPSFRLDLTDICMKCEHCYATQEEPRIATEDEVKLMIDTVDDFVHEARIDNEEATEIDFGRTDIMYPGHEDTLLARISLALRSLKEKGITNIKSKLYTSGMLHKTNPKKFKETAKVYAGMFREFFNGNIGRDMTFFMNSPGDKYHTKRLDIKAAAEAYAILVLTIRKYLDEKNLNHNEEEDILDNARTSIGGETTEYDKRGILVATPRTKRYVEKTGAKVDRTCPGLGISYARDVRKLGIEVEDEHPGSGSERLTLTKDGYVTICPCGISPIALQGKGAYQRAISNIQNDPLVKTLVTKGPLGVAELLDKKREDTFDSALETYKQFGACYVCRELLPIMQQHVRNLG